MVLSMIPKRFSLILIIFCEIIVCKRMVPTSGEGGINYKKLNECRRCKILTDSFSHWVEKTARGKYEGGDAAWEEAKLKSYSRSEMRLIEIQEGLCSEVKLHQDPCYAIAEEAEQVLEKWWFHEDPSSDLYTWLCIETLQHCCPSSHYGDNCAPCPLYNKEVCGGNGKCDGDGTRKGNGTCLCKRGYRGSLCNECSKNFFLSSAGTCQPCHISCDDCTADGPKACKACSTGWEMKSGVCTDIDECSSSVCESQEFCVNSEGFYKCKKCDMSCNTCIGEGPSNCTSCENKLLWSGNCIDEELKLSILNLAFKRLALYIGLLVITIFVYRASRLLASLVVLAIAVYIYFAEKNLSMNLLDVISNLIYVPG